MGGLFITQSISGFYSWDRFEYFCIDDSYCDTGKSCCLFYEEDYGVCDDFSVCSSISKVSMEEKQQFSVLEEPDFEVEKEVLFDAVKAHIEEPRTNYSRNSMIVGLILIAFAIVVYAFTSKNIQHPNYGQSKFEKKRKKK